jgi:2-polyprenyl-3-methyl-5-hydroxy-6-metoxy-1,4-benzoquinol methylase
MIDDSLEYQFGFSETHRGAMYDAEQRTQKALKTVAVIQDYLAGVGKDTADISLLDIGCSTGYLSRVYGQHFGRVVGIDIDRPAVDFARKTVSGDHIAFHVRDSMSTGFPGDSFDAVTCT